MYHIITEMHLLDTDESRCTYLKQTKKLIISIYYK